MDDEIGLPNLYYLELETVLTIGYIVELGTLHLREDREAIALIFIDAFTLLASTLYLFIGKKNVLQKTLLILAYQSSCQNPQSENFLLREKYDHIYCEQT